MILLLWMSSKTTFFLLFRWLKGSLWEWKYLEIDFGVEELYRNARSSTYVVAR